MKHQRVYAKIDISAIVKNISGVRSRIPQNTMIMAVIKADAYGHGAAVLASELQNKADWFGVSNVLEAVELRKSGITNPILILGYVAPAEYFDIVENNITIAMFDYADAKKLSDLAVSRSKVANVHIKVDTGMSRIGYRVTEENADEAVKIADLPGVSVGGIFTHLARADESDKSSAKKQIEAFESFDKMLKIRGLDVHVRHVENSAAVMEMSSPYEMVRMGIMLYGLYPSEEMSRSYKLYPAMELISHVSMVKTIEKGDGVSYGHTYIASDTKKVATVPVGYADGYPRCLSNKGAVLIDGVKCPVLGRVCMDQLMVDVSHAENVSVGDDVILFGEDLPVDKVAALANTINYEVVCGVSRRVPRVYYKDGVEQKTVCYI